MVYAWLWMNLRQEGIPYTGRFATPVPFGPAHYSGRNLERPFISYSVKSKIDHHVKQVKKQNTLSVHNLFTIVINKLLITSAS